MGKAKTARRLADNEAQAVTRNLRVSPQKLNLVATSIRGKKVEKALADLTFSRRAHRQRRQENAGISHRQCREQSRPRC